MKTDTDYWIFNIGLHAAAGYAEGDRERSFHKIQDDYAVIDNYVDEMKAVDSGIYSAMRLSRAGHNHDFFALPPKFARQAVGDSEFDFDSLLGLHEPEVARFNFERVANGLTMLTCLNPVTGKSYAASTNNRPPWLVTEINSKDAPSFTNHTQQNAWYMQRHQDYRHAVMLKVFTSDLAYDFQRDLVPLAQRDVAFETKLDLLRGEFKEYLAKGVPANLFTELLPGK